MNDGRRRRNAKQARRHTKCSAKRQPSNLEPGSLQQLVRTSLAKHPVHLLDVAAYPIARATPDRHAFLKAECEEPLRLGDVVAALADDPCREITALLSVLAELLVEDEEVRAQCHQALATRADRLPTWIAELSRVHVHRAVRRALVLGDGDEILVGARLAGGAELTIATYVDHNELSSLQEISVFGCSIAEVLAEVDTNMDPDTAYLDMSLADARAWIEQGLGKAEFLPHPDAWRWSLPIVKWLVKRMPDGGVGRQGPDFDDDALPQLLADFFASAAGAPFRDPDYEHLLVELFDSGSRDPRLWSATRVEWLLRSTDTGEAFPLEIALDVPAVLRAFVPFAHAQNEVRAEHTDRTLAAIDDMSRTYKQNLLKEATSMYEEDEPGPPPWWGDRNQAS